MNYHAKVLSCRPFSAEGLEIENNIYEYWSTFVRYGPRNWSVLMGESDEPVGDEEIIDALEIAYKEHKKGEGYHRTVEKACKFLVDEADRIYLALSDGDLKKGKYSTFHRAIQEAVESLKHADETR